MWHKKTRDGKGKERKKERKNDAMQTYQNFSDNTSNTIINILMSE